MVQKQKVFIPVNLQETLKQGASRPDHRIYPMGYPRIPRTPSSFEGSLTVSNTSSSCHCFLLISEVHAFSKTNGKEEKYISAVDEYAGSIVSIYRLFHFDMQY